MTTRIKLRRRDTFRPAGFTLVELLVTISIIAILAGVVLGALNATRRTAKLAKTKATIAKLDRVIMQQYNRYKSRRVPINTAGMDPNDAAVYRYKAIHDLMRMEMPDRSGDLMKKTNPVILDDRPAASRRFLQIWLANRTDRTLDYLPAECLYMIVSNSSGMEHFSESEIGDYDQDGFPEFIDAWGKPIMFLRWAPQFLRPDSDLQSGNPTTDHDPFDTRKQFAIAYHLYPLIYSAGPDGDYGISTGAFRFDGCPIVTLSGSTAGDLNDAGSPVGLGHHDNIHNHRIEAR